VHDQAEAASERITSSGDGVGCAFSALIRTLSNTPPADGEWIVHMTEAMPLVAASSREVT
jgi:hypothetical protein